MLWKIVIALIAIVAVSVGLGIWGWYGFPVPEKLIAVATFLSAIGTLIIALITHNQLKHNRQVARAYVNISPNTDNVVFGTEGRIGINLQIKNHGATPALVTDVVITADTLLNGQSLPKNLRYRRSDEGEVVTAFLVSNDYFFIDVTLRLDPAHVDEVSEGSRTLLIFGYVDYTDQFHQRHRGGFARRYNRTWMPHFTVVTGPEYNYDRTFRRRHRMMGGRLVTGTE